MNPHLSFFVYAILPWVLSAFTIAVAWLSGNKWRYTFAVGLFAQVLWILYIFATAAWGLLLGCLALVIVYARNHAKWNPTDPEQEEAAEFFVTARLVRQAHVAQWVRDSFGAVCMSDPQERVARVLEEAIELAQAEGLPMRTASAMLRHVYRKEPGKPEVELGAVGLTLLAYAECRGFNADAAERAEVQRVLDMPREHWQSRAQHKVEQGLARLDGRRAWE